MLCVIQFYGSSYMYPHYNIIQNSFTALKILCILTTYLWKFGNYWPFYYSLTFPECHVGEIIQHVVFSDLLSFINIHLSSLPAFLQLDGSSFKIAESYSICCTMVCLFIHPLKDILVASNFGQLLIKLL